MDFVAIGEATSNMLMEFLRENKLKANLMMSDQSDGCATMLGVYKGKLFLSLVWLLMLRL